MKLLFDQNLSSRLVTELIRDFPASQHVRDLSLASASDSSIWFHAVQNQFAIVSKDVDFQQRALLLGHPPKVVWIRLGNCSTDAVANLLRSKKQLLLDFESDPSASFLVLR